MLTQTTKPNPVSNAAFSLFINGTEVRARKTAWDTPERFALAEVPQEFSNDEIVAVQISGGVGEPLTLVHLDLYRKRSGKPLPVTAIRKQTAYSRIVYVRNECVATQKT